MRSCSMPDMDGATELDSAQGQRERHGRKTDQHQHPECIDIGQERSLCLHLLSDPLNGLIMGLYQPAAMGRESNS